MLSARDVRLPVDLPECCGGPTGAVTFGLRAIVVRLKSATGVVAVDADALCDTVRDRADTSYLIVSFRRCEAVITGNLSPRSQKNVSETIEACAKPCKALHEKLRATACSPSPNGR